MRLPEPRRLQRREEQDVITYKTAWRGIPSDDVDPEYTSQRCPRTECHHTERANRTKKRFKCRECGFQDRADRKAAVCVVQEWLDEQYGNVPSLETLTRVEGETGGIGGWWRPRLSRMQFAFGCHRRRYAGARLSKSSARGIKLRCLCGAGVNTDASRHRARGTSLTSELPATRSTPVQNCVFNSAATYFI
nr:zinc ribbon domain-containing protein [Halorientalis sp.]